MWFRQCGSASVAQSRTEVEAQIICVVRPIHAQHFWPFSKDLGLGTSLCDNTACHPSLVLEDGAPIPVDSSKLGQQPLQLFLGCFTAKPTRHNLLL
jgi:hypothetical protein